MELWFTWTCGLSDTALNGHTYSQINGKGASVGKCAGRFMQKLYRLDTQRWSTVKPAEVAKPEQPEKKKKKKASAATSRTESGNRRASFSVQSAFSKSCP